MKKQNIEFLQELRLLMNRYKNISIDCDYNDENTTSNIVIYDNEANENIFKANNSISSEELLSVKVISFSAESLLKLKGYISDKLKKLAHPWMISEDDILSEINDEGGIFDYIIEEFESGDRLPIQKKNLSGDDWYYVMQDINGNEILLDMVEFCRDFEWEIIEKYK